MEKKQMPCKDNAIMHPKHWVSREYIYKYIKVCMFIHVWILQTHLHFTPAPEHLSCKGSASLLSRTLSAILFFSWALRWENRLSSRGERASNRLVRAALPAAVSVPFPQGFPCVFRCLTVGIIPPEDDGDVLGKSRGGFWVCPGAARQPRWNICRRFRRVKHCRVDDHSTTPL